MREGGKGGNGSAQKWDQYHQKRITLLLSHRLLGRHEKKGERELKGEQGEEAENKDDK